MKIVYVGPFRMPNMDAAAARVLNNSRALKESGHLVTIISWGGCYRNEDKGLDGRYRIDGVEYIVTDELDAKGSILKKAMLLNKRGKITFQLLNDEKFKDIDVIITYNASNRFSKQVLAFCRSRNIKMISDITEWYDSGELYFFQRKANMDNMTKTQYKVKNKIVISSYLDNVYKDSHNIIIPATSDISEMKWHGDKDCILSKIGRFDGITLIYAGTPSKKDALHYVIGAVDRLSKEGEKLRFLVLGCERESYLKEFNASLDKGELSESIVFLGRISQDEVPSYYAVSDFMVLLREQNRKNNAGFPTKFTESFTSGTPVIANITSDLGKYLVDGKTGFVVKEASEDAIYNVLKRKILILNHSQIEDIKQNVRDISRRLDYHTYIKPLTDFMNSLE